MALRAAPRLRWLALGAFLFTATAWGHAFPVRSNPPVGAVLKHAPARVTIWFDADLSPPFSHLKVTALDGRRVSVGAARVPDGHRRQLTVKLDALAPGTYLVSWSVVAADGHHTEGRFRFSVQ